MWQYDNGFTYYTSNYIYHESNNFYPWSKFTCCYEYYPFLPDKDRSIHVDEKNKRLKVILDRYSSRLYLTLRYHGVDIKQKMKVASPDQLLFWKFDNWITICIPLVAENRKNCFKIFALREIIKATLFSFNQQCKYSKMLLKTSVIKILVGFFMSFSRLKNIIICLVL